MIYEIEVGEHKHIANIEKNETGYRIQIDNGEAFEIKNMNLSAKTLHLISGSRSISLCHALVDDVQELHWEGLRIVGKAIDKRKKALQLVGAAGGDTVVSQMPGRVLSVLVSVGDAVHKGDVVAKIEAMKMENPLKAPRDGIVAEVCVQAEDLVKAKGVVLKLAPV